MKKLVCFTIVLLLLASISIFGAWAPVVQEATVRYADAPIVSTVASEQIYYTSREIVEEVDTPGGAPLYTNAYNFQNACGPLAGTAIVAYYDKYNPELIPDWESFFSESGKYRNQAGDNISAVFHELYTLMQTNVNGNGVSESEFKTGLKTYITNHGYSVSYTSAKSGSTLHYATCKAAINNNKVIALFIKPGAVYDIGLFSDHDTLTEANITGNHIMYAYGYLQINYYNSNGLFRTETFLKVSTGYVSPSLAYYKLDSTNLEAAYIVTVK